MNRQQDKARTLAHQTEALAEIDSVMSLIREAVNRLVEAHAGASRSHRQLVAANTLVSGPQFVQTECSDCYGVGVLNGDRCPGCKGRVALGAVAS